MTDSAHKIETMRQLAALQAERNARSPEQRRRHVAATTVTGPNKGVNDLFAAMVSAAEDRRARILAPAGHRLAVSRRDSGVLLVRSIQDRTVELSFSSEAPIVQNGCIEILDHSPSSADLSRLNTGAALLEEHERSQQIGVVERAWIDTNQKKGRALVRFSKNARADDIFKDVVDGIRRLVSVGYQVLDYILIDGGIRATKWQPFEISIVTVPADVSVGVGRSLTRSRVLAATRQQRGHFVDRAAIAHAAHVQALTENP